MEYCSAHTVAEATALLASAGSVKPIAGGTDLAVALADALNPPDMLVDISGIAGLRGIRRSKEECAIGAAVTIAEIAARVDLPACLVQGARSIGSPQIRCLATIGGNVCNASPCGDTLAPLVALDAVLVLASAAATRKVPIEEFFLGPKKTQIARNELLVEILIPSHYLGGSSSFRMIGKRNGQAISQVNAAVWVALLEGTIGAARAAVGSVAPVPLRLRKTEALLAGQKLDAIDIEEALDCMDSEIAPISDVRASVEYRRLAARSLFKDALTEALGA